MEVHVYHHIVWNESKLDQILTLLNNLTIGEQKMASDLATLEAQVKANTDTEQSALLLLNQLHQMLMDARSDPAKLDEIITQLGASQQSLAAAIAANTA